MANELLQWVAIVFIAVFLLGLTRQLGMFLVPRPRQLEDQGPALGKPLASEIIDAELATQMRSAMRDAEAPGAVLVLVDEGCATCKALVDDLAANRNRRRNSMPARMPTAAIIKDSSQPFVDLAVEGFDFIATDPSKAALGKAGLNATPFVLIVDGQMRVRRRRLSSDIRSVAREWLREGDRSVESTGDAPDSGSTKRGSTDAGGRGGVSPNPDTEVIGV